MRTAPCESTPRRLAHTSTSASVAAPSAVMPFAAKMSVKTRNSSDWSTRMAPIACTFFAEDRTAGRGSLAEPAASVQDCGWGTASALPLPLLQGERVGVICARLSMRSDSRIVYGAAAEARRDDGGFGGRDFGRFATGAVL